MKKNGSGTLKFVLSIMLAGPVGFGIGFGATKLIFGLINKTPEQFEKYKDYFNTTKEGKVIRTKLDGNPIDVVISQVDSVTRQRIVDAVNALDDISTNINYRIYDAANYDYKNQNYIEISLAELGDKAAAGATTYSYNVDSGIMAYPITIEIEKELVDNYWDFENQQSMLTSVVKHELGHTLGLKDIYDPKDKANTIMYYAINYSAAHDYTDRDKAIIQYCYDGKEPETEIQNAHYVYVNKPKEAVITYNNIEEDALEF